MLVYINNKYLTLKKFLMNNGTVIISTSVPGPSRWDGDEDPGKIRFIVPNFGEKIACAVQHNRIAITVE